VGGYAPEGGVAQGAAQAVDLGVQRGRDEEGDPEAGLSGR